jgi:hypothetical protein
LKSICLGAAKLHASREPLDRKVALTVACGDRMFAGDRVHQGKVSS